MTINIIPSAKGVYLSLFLLLLTGIISQHALGQCTLPVPSGLKLRNQTSCSVDVSWKKVSGSSYYRVEYRISGDTTWMFSDPLPATSLTVAGLAANASYDFAVASFCSDSVTAGYSAALSKATKKCSAPANIFSSHITINSAVISWTPLCGSNNFTLQYRLAGTSVWTKVKDITSINYMISDLQAGMTYEYSLQTDCGPVNSTWLPVSTFTTLNPDAPGKNILLIVLDDARYDAFIPNGAPSWFSTPAINSIAGEGVNFQITIPTTSQCSPSRACIYTGLYPHTNGVTKNGDTLSSTLPLIQQVLKDQGYYTGFVGKYGQFLGEPRGFSWWAVSEGDEYLDPPYRINGYDTTIAGHISDVYPQLALDFLNSVPAGQNFALFYFTRVPHYPTQPGLDEQLLYLNETIPFPANFSFYDDNYPSFYQDGKWGTADTAEVMDLKLRTYQSLKGADDNVATIFSWLNEQGLKDSTLIILTSDNGYLMGEHKMHEKILALEESIRVPLFLRYPSWFDTSAIVTDEIASNLDIATTLLDFAGVTDTFGFQGLSLRQLAKGEVHRKNFLYESGWDPYYPKLRAVRTLTDMYIRSYCKTVTEEFYDLAIDPAENTNQIFNPLYQDTIFQRKQLLDSLRGAFSDLTPTKKTCNLVSTGEKEWLLMNDIEFPAELTVLSNPASQQFTVIFKNQKRRPAVMKIYNSLNQEVLSRDAGAEMFYEELDCSLWSGGIYFVIVEQGAKMYQRKVFVIGK